VDEYGEVEDKVLKRLGPNAKQALEATLEQLTTKFNWQLKTGPGRKSNAEHALHFYQYLLDKVSSEEYIAAAAVSGDERQATAAAAEGENNNKTVAPEAGAVGMDENDEEGQDSASVGEEQEGIDDEDEESHDAETDDDDEEDENSSDEENEDDEHESEGGESDSCQSAKEDEEEPAEAVEKEEEEAIETGGEGEDEAIPNEESNKPSEMSIADEAKERKPNGQSTDENPDPAPVTSIQHQDTCCVSGETADEVAKCSTCDKIFVLQYLRPVTEAIPTDPNWRCAYCVLSTEPKHTKQRRESAAAVRLMARLRNGLKRKKMEETKLRKETKSEEIKSEETMATRRSKDAAQQETSIRTDGEDSPKAPAVGNQNDSSEEAGDKPTAILASETTETKLEPSKDVDKPNETAWDDEHGDNEDRDANSAKNSDSPRRNKRNLMLAKLADTFSPDMESPDGLGKRSRKQPTLYDPQLVPARDWQSDEVNQTSGQESDDSDSEDGDNKSRGKGAGDTQKDQEATPPTGPVAGSSETKGSRGRTVPEGEVWCAFCGDDPVITICCFCACRVCFCKENKEKTLICDGCDEEYHIYCLDPPLDSIPTESPWHCPPCDTQRKKQTETPAPRSPSRTSRTSAAEASPKIEAKRESKRGPGRPPKTEEKKENKKSPGRPPKAEEKEAKRGPGRPKKSSEEKEAKRGPGRPRKSDTVSKRGPGRPPSKERRGPGRPPKSEKRGPGRPPSSERRGPGRPPKKKSEKARPAKASKSAKTKRKRGRPPKIRDLDDDSMAEVVVVDEPSPRSSRAGKSTTGRKRGRPPKVKKEEPPKKKMKPPMRSADGRFVSPSKNEKSDGKSAAKSDTKKSQTKVKMAPVQPMLMPVVVSRSGRTVKRSSFHDEIDEGEQHLKSYRQAQEAQSKRSATVAGLKKPPPTAAGVAAASSLQEQPPFPTQEHFGSASFSENIDLSEMDELEVRRSNSQDESTKMARYEPFSIEGGDGITTRHSSLLETSRRKSSVFSSDASLPGASAVSAVDLDAANQSRTPRRKPGARECMQISRRFGVRTIPEKYIEILMDYCKRGKVEHLIRMRERLDEHSRYLEAQLAGLEAAVKAKGETDVVVPSLPEGPDRKLERTIAGEMFDA